MNYTSILLALFEFVLTGSLALLVVYMTYRLFAVTSPDYDPEVELKKGNLGAGILLAALIVSAGLIVREGIYPTINLVRLYFTSPDSYLTGPQVLALAFGHLGLVFVVAVYSMSWSLRFWGRLTTRIDEGEELKRGNAAVGIVLAGVVAVMAIFMSDAISRLTKAMIPQPSLGHVEIMR